MVVQDKKAVADGLAWFANVSTSVVIVFINKILMDPSSYRFTYATTLCAFHFMACAASVWAAQAAGFAQKATLPWGEVLMFALVANVSIASLNLSLLLNTVGFYQIAKLMIIPFVCVVELVWLRRSFTVPTMLSVATVIVGVAIVTVTDVTVNTMGLVIAGISVIASGMQQILCGTVQRKHKISSHQLLSNTAPVQGVILLIVGPWVDLGVTGKWVMNYEASVPALLYLFLSCAVAVLVNISQFMCLGRFSATTFQVLGHTKTILVLLISWLGLHEPMSPRKLGGMTLAVAGMVAYGYYSSQKPPAKATAGSKDPELLPLVLKEKMSDQNES